ncbi:Pre protein translocase subunit Sec66-domain-containing protein [Pisolithus thermaeus]|nr:Pre protein translocase subunit Sec66-domain-containing protein [Pisolithus croceorrhizus]KAI6162475.1 Pre protein translocase subunit Sec66-domain-containing protein [Pisolithus thermaeus]
MASVLVPVLYVGIVIGSLLIFSHFYRKRNTGKIYEPYFPSHPERDVYVTLLQQTDPPPHEALLKAALLRRAMTDVSRVVKLREDKPALQNLLQKGSIGDDLWNSLLQAEKELEAEIMEVVAEANTFVEGWGGLIFQTAGEMLANEKMRMQKYGKVGKTVELPAPSPMAGSGLPPPGSLPPAAMLAAMQAHAQAQAQAQTKAQAQGRPAPTSTPEKPLGGLTPPGSGRPEGVVSSDGEGEPSRPPSKSPKKNKKRR